MASACFLLDGDVRLIASTGESAGARGICFLEFWVAEETGQKSPVPSDDDDDDDDDEPWWLDRDRVEEEVKPKSLVDWVQEGLVKVTTDKLVSHLEIYTLSLHLPATPREIVAQLQSASIGSADKSLLVLHTGHKWNYCASSGRYLVCDAAANALFAAPPIDSLDLVEMPGCRPVVMRRGGGSGDFILALLVTSRRTRQYSLLLWSPFALGGKGQQWVPKAASLPKDVVQFDFKVDVAFAFQDQWAGWVDLHLGILTCDLLLFEPQFQLKPLPVERSSYRGHPYAYSTVGCVDGKVKFLYMRGFDVCRDGEVPEDEITLNNWTLVGTFLDHCSWVKDDNTTLSVGDLWDDESFLASPGLPKCLPSVPVLSPKEPDVVYFILNDVCCVDGRNTAKAQYALSLNLQSKKVQSWVECSLESLRMCPSFIAADLCAYREPSNPDDQVAQLIKYTMKNDDDDEDMVDADTPNFEVNAMHKRRKLD